MNFLLLTNTKKLFINLKFKYFIPVLIWTGIITYLSAVSGNALPKPLFKGFDKVAHFGVYFIEAYLWCYAFYKIKFKFISFYILSFCLAVFWGVFMEFCQEYIFIKRSIEFYDIIANTIGALFGVICFKYIKI
ncbi:MAG: hypothetical protein Kow0079_04160 [Vicingaceae bacterium]